MKEFLAKGKKWVFRHLIRVRLWKLPGQAWTRSRAGLMQPQILRYLPLWRMLGSCGDKTSLPSHHDLQSNHLLLHGPKTWWLKTTTITILYHPWFGVDHAYPGKFLFSIYHAVAVKRWLGLQSSQKLLQLYDWPLMIAVRWDLSQHVASPCDQC